MKTTILLIIAFALSGCTAATAYQSRVAARQTSLSGYSKGSNYGGTVSHRVEYR